MTELTHEETIAFSKETVTELLKELHIKIAKDVALLVDMSDKAEHAVYARDDNKTYDVLIEAMHIQGAILNKSRQLNTMYENFLNEINK